MILLVDADSIPYTVCHNKKDEPVKDLSDCIKGANNILNSIANAVDADKIHLFFTLSRGFRYNIYPEYKANRKQSKPPFFYETRDYLVKEYKGISQSDLEADDLLNIYKNYYIEKDIPYIIYSKDKDIKNLIGKHYDPDSNLMNIVFNSHAEEYFWKSMIIGDQADNIKGIPRKGASFANKLYDKCLDKTNEKKTFELFKQEILNEYIKHFGSKELGEVEFKKNYECLKILDSYEGMMFQEPISIKDIYARTLGVVGE